MCVLRYMWYGCVRLRRLWLYERLRDLMRGGWVGWWFQASVELDDDMTDCVSV